MDTSRTPGPGGAAVVGSYVLLCELGQQVPTFIARPRAATTNDPLVIIERFPSSALPLAAARSAEQLTRLHHPNLARIRAVVSGLGTASVVSDYVEGEALSEFERAAQAAAKNIPIVAKLRIVVDLLNGLSALHGHTDAQGAPLKLVHGEVSPAHALVGIDGTTRLVHLFRAKATAGTTPYVAPELRGGGKVADARADLYGVGVILWEALSGRALAETESPVPRLRVPKEKEWAAALVDVAARATAVNAAERFASAAEMAAEVRKIAKERLPTPARVAAVLADVAGARIAERAARVAGLTPLPAKPASPAVAPPAPMPSAPTPAPSAARPPSAPTPAPSAARPPSAPTPPPGRPLPSASKIATPVAKPALPRPLPQPPRAPARPAADVAPSAAAEPEPAQAQAPTAATPEPATVAPVVATAPPPSLPDEEIPISFDPQSMRDAVAPTAAPRDDPSSAASTTAAVTESDVHEVGAETMAPVTPSVAPRSERKRRAAILIGVGVACMLAIVFALARSLMPTHPPTAQAGDSPSAAAHSVTPNGVEPGQKPTEAPASASTTTTPTGNADTPAPEATDAAAPPKSTSPSAAPPTPSPPATTAPATTTATTSPAPAAHDAAPAPSPGAPKNYDPLGI